MPENVKKKVSLSTSISKTKYGTEYYIKARKLREFGLTYSNIADKLGVGLRTAYRLCKIITKNQDILGSMRSYDKKNGTQTDRIVRS